ncbi:MAG: sensor domain-containing protein [Coriobacteriia bacterium]|nr:sensor domain-containing protein [Coriobacteriia bacterium]
MNTEQYLDGLRTALAGADPALVQDAVYDAEEYLRSEMADCEGDEETCFAAIVERYGTPEEVAAAYLETEVTVARALRPPAVSAPGSPLGRFFGAVTDPRSYAALVYLLLSLVTGAVYFTLVAALLPTSLALLPIGVGLLLLLLFFAMVRAISLAEGRVVEALLGVRMPRRPRGVIRSGDLGERIKYWLTDGRTWTSILYMVLQLPLGVIYFTLVVTALSLSASGVAYPIVQLFTDYPLFQWGGYGYMLAPWATPLVIAAGLLGFVLTLHLCKGIGWLHAAYAKALLVGRYTDAPSGDQ